MTEREGRGRAEVRDPAQAIAIAKCWLASWVKRAGSVNLPPVDSFHPDACGWCEVPRDLLIQMLEEFQAWSGVSSYDSEHPLRVELEQWEMLPAYEQARLIAKAQGFNEPDRGRGAEDRRAPW